MNLSEEQKQILSQKLSEGASIADIQRTITDEFKIHATYMETRFLMDDLNLELKAVEPKPEPVAVEESLPGIEKQQESEGSVSVEVDRVKQPGAALSGTVTFSDGVSAKWYIDPMGRLGLDAGEEGYQPSEEDIESFQLELRKQMQGPEI